MSGHGELHCYFVYELLPATINISVLRYTICAHADYRTNLFRCNIIIDDWFNFII